jgi:type IV fimbrial biogenesis protein FimT
MAELLGVVAMIGVLAAAAAPMVVKMTRDKRVQSAAYQVASLYRTARARALGRGSAVLVRWDANHAQPTSANPHGHFSIREAIDAATGLPAPSCQLTNWTEASTSSRFVAAFDERATTYKPAEARFFDPTDAEKGYADVCFSPRGRTFVRYAPADAFAALTGVPRVEMKNTSTAFIRQVVIVPNGVARVVGRVN